MAGFAPMPSRGGAQPSPSDSPESSNPSSLISQPDKPEQSNGPDELSDAIIRKIRDLHTTIDAIARQFPEFADAGREAQDALTKGMSKIVSKQRSPQQGGATPPVG